MTAKVTLHDKHVSRTCIVGTPLGPSESVCHMAGVPSSGDDIGGGGGGGGAGWRVEEGGSTIHIVQLHHASTPQPFMH